MLTAHFIYLIDFCQYIFQHRFIPHHMCASYCVLHSPSNLHIKAFATTESHVLDIISFYIEEIFYSHFVSTSHSSDWINGVYRHSTRTHLQSEETRSTRVYPYSVRDKLVLFFTVVPLASPPAALRQRTFNLSLYCVHQFEPSSMLHSYIPATVLHVQCVIWSYWSTVQDER